MRFVSFGFVFGASLFLQVNVAAQSSQSNINQRAQSVALSIEGVAPEDALNCKVANQIRMTNAMINGGNVSKAKKYAFRSKVWAEVYKRDSDKTLKELVSALGDKYLLKGVRIEEMGRPSKSSVKKAKKVDKKCKKFAQGYEE